MIEKIPFGGTGHQSSRAIFGAAGLWAMKQEKADQVLETLSKYGVNHIDVAATYGDAELRVGSWMKEHRDKFFLATKTGERTASGARNGIRLSLERLQTDRIDLIQLHNLTDEPDWETAMGPGGALEATTEARRQGLVRFIGVTGHGTRAAEMHIRSLERFEFDSVLFPFNFLLLQDPVYASSVERLLKICASRGIAVQTIKSIARRRWRPGDARKRFSWYEPVKDHDTLNRLVHWVLRKPGIFLNTSSDITLLPLILQAACGYNDGAARPDLDDALRADAARLEMEPLFIRGVADTV
jgi:aryl-alcohol dehydrogenase-like predicted oxidoreductase